MTTKVINGIFYNTETAICIHSWDNSLSYTDFHFMSESLYKSSKNYYFLVGSGGPMSKYAISHGNMTSGSQNVVTPLSPEEAFNWLCALEHDCETETIIKFFPDFIEEA